MNTPIDTKIALTDHRQNYVSVSPILYEWLQKVADAPGIEDLAREFIEVIHKHDNITYAKAELALEYAKMMLDNEIIKANPKIENFYDNKLYNGADNFNDLIS